MLFIPSRFTGTDGPSGFGFELTFRLKRETGESAPPTWPAELMQGLARYVFQSGKSPRSWLVCLSVHHEPAWVGNLKVYFDVCERTFPGSAILHLYHKGGLFPGWKAAWAMGGKDMSYDLLQWESLTP